MTDDEIPKEHDKLRREAAAQLRDAVDARIKRVVVTFAVAADATRIRITGIATYEGTPPDCQPPRRAKVDALGETLSRLWQACWQAPWRQGWLELRRQESGSIAALLDLTGSPPPT